VISVVLADDQALAWAGFRTRLESEADMEVLGEAAGGDQAVRVARVVRPAVG
jgi:DNA-binding NarL/FixJ family response regulator